MTDSIETVTSVSELCSDCFALILKLRTSREFGDPALLRRRIIDFLTQIERESRQIGIDMESIQSVKFALVAFIDETIVTSDWSERSAWQDNPLQFQIFERLDAGEEFFQKLRDLRMHSRANAAVIDVYYHCLALGFRGKYQVHDTEKLKLLLDDLYLELCQISGKSSENLSPHGLSKDEWVKNMVGWIPWWVIIASAATLAALFYLILIVLLSRSNG